MVKSTHIFRICTTSGVLSYVISFTMRLFAGDGGWLLGFSPRHTVNDGRFIIGMGVSMNQNGTLIE